MTLGLSSGLDREKGASVSRNQFEFALGRLTDETVVELENLSTAAVWNSYSLATVFPSFLLAKGTRNGMIIAEGEGPGGS